jgi:lipopolysaccharide export system permease protein
MWTRLDRYFYKELSGPFGITLAFLTSLLLINQLLRLMELFLNSGAGLLLLGKIFLLILPSFLLVTMPIASLISTLVTFSRLTADGELTALTSAGIGLIRMIRPLFLFSLVVSFLTYLLSILTTPWSGTSFKDMALNLLKTQTTVNIEEGVFNDLSDKLMIYVNQIESQDQLKGVFISDLRNPKEPILIVASEGMLLNTLSPEIIGLRLLQGTIHQRDQDSQGYERMIMFASYDLKIELDSSFASPPIQQPSLKEIQTMLADSNGNDVKALRYLQEYHKNFAFPFACLIFGLLGAPLGIGFQKSGRLGGFVIGILVVLFYYSVSVMGDILVAARYLSPWLGAWFPNILSIVVTVLIIWRFAKRIG